MLSVFMFQNLKPSGIADLTASTVSTSTIAQLRLYLPLRYLACYLKAKLFLQEITCFLQVFFLFFYQTETIIRTQTK